MRQRLSWFLTLLMVFSALPVLSTATASAEPLAGEPFNRTWARTDQPLAQGQVSRTWMWGPEPFTGAMQEEYAQTPGGQRTVQYFDKSRMEITNPGGDQSSPWYVTNGLLVMELVTGRMQTGNDSFIDRSPAQVNVAGDADDADGPTYATFGPLRSASPAADGATLTSRVNRQGTVSNDPALAQYGVTAAHRVTMTGLDHQIASPFWTFMNSSGLVLEGGQTQHARLFEDPFYATGLPITEAYWASVEIDGIARDVLMQCFERRCLTFTPGNDPAWQVEAGNVGLHYYAWRYLDAAEGPSAQANELALAVTRAHSDEARYEALLAVLDALHIGVYTGNGTQVLGGAERGAADFYLYDAELRMLAAAQGRGDTWGVADVAMMLTAMEILPQGETLSPHLVRQALLNGVGAAKASPQDWSSLSPLLLRQLGVSAARPYDLFAAPSLDLIRLDALGYFLLLSELSVPLVAEQLPLEASASELVALSNGVLTATASDPCAPPSVFNGNAAKDAWGWTKIFAELMQMAPHAVGKGTAVIDAVHGAMLAYSVRVTALDETREGHYGHGGAGETMTFRVKVEMLDDVGDMLLNCGWIVGASFPTKGPIQGVSVHWFWPELAKHGTINCGTACPSAGENGLSIDATNAEGIATMTVYLKNEQNPGAGWVVEETGTVTGIALYQSKFTNLLGSYAQYLTPKSGATRWTVKWHETPGWNVTLTLDYDVLANWKVLIYQGNEGYFEEVIGANGQIVLKMTLPASAAEGQNGSWGMEATGSGQGHFVYRTTDYTTYQAYDHWVSNCNTPWEGNWPAFTTLADFKTMPGGEQWATFQPVIAPVLSLYQNSDDARCMTDVTTLMILTLLKPEFSLNTSVPQTRSLDANQLCQATFHNTLFKVDIGTTEPHPRSLQSCSATAQWTAVVEWNSPPPGN